MIIVTRRLVNLQINYHGLSVKFKTTDRRKGMNILLVMPRSISLQILDTEDYAAKLLRASTTPLFPQPRFQKPMIYWVRFRTDRSGIQQFF